jgi:hypothetical protein
MESLSICSLLFINVTKSFTFLLFVDTTCFGLTRPSSGVIVHFTEAGALLCHFSPCQGASHVLLLMVCLSVSVC